ncbi:ferrochelatase [Magnetococcus marinus MC-1]|uniref:Ferrochelatase n=1 Tax=Magnetococcus marinus (strain ATCC BAA-1437 / JCM 17883 / MC-1) TaxID=156889 RepID=A0L8B7_MAGMM|nr:ferrochelatase [Magnetococcus marinus]ABK44210.1 ferrochelatase [Magnetococcus marinus MC-1]
MAQAETAILLVQLGTPDQPTEEAVRRYLRQFLSDRRVVDMNRLLWWPLLHGIILRSRPSKSAKLYKKIWRDDKTSPLLHYTRALQQEMARRFQGRHSSGVRVDFAMRYGNPGLRCKVGSLVREGVRRLLIVPLFPQYAGATVASVMDEVMRPMHIHRLMPTLRVMTPYYAQDAYIDALVASLEGVDLSEPDHRLLLSYHGLPKRHVDEGDPYENHCQTTTLLLTEELDLRHDQWMMSYQSRFGSEPWLEPNTDMLFKTLPSQGIKKLTVMCPGFAADCLETLEEISETGRQTFLKAGGSHFNYIPCLNDEPYWVDALEKMIEDEMHGWLHGPMSA